MPSWGEAWGESWSGSWGPLGPDVPDAPGSVDILDFGEHSVRLSSSLECSVAVTDEIPFGSVLDGGAADTVFSNITDGGNAGQSFSQIIAGGSARWFATVNLSTRTNITIADRAESAVSLRDFEL